jgi:hypothetical protein
MYSSHRMSRSRIVMFGGQDFIAGYCGPDVQLSQLSRSRIVMFGGQDFISGYCGPDVLLYSSHRMSRSRIIMFGGQDFISGGPDVQLSQDVYQNC